MFAVPLLATFFSDRGLTEFYFLLDCRGILNKVMCFLSLSTLTAETRNQTPHVSTWRELTKNLHVSMVLTLMQRVLKLSDEEKV